MIDKHYGLIDNSKNIDADQFCELLDEMIDE